MSDWRNEDWGEQNSYGIDLTMLRYNLSLTPEERWNQHQRALEFALLCMEEAKNARLSRSASFPE